MAFQRFGIALFFRRWFTCFLVLGIVFIPFRFFSTDAQLQLTQFVFSRLISSVTAVLNLHPVLTDFSSDSVYLYCLVACLLLLAFVCSLAIQWGAFEVVFDEKLVPWCLVLFRYYLALLLFKYGFDKLFKAQFYLPEPNLLFTPMGRLDKDILFWSTMGVSRAYCLFMGMIEVIPAVLLLFRRTSLLGAVVAAGVLLNVFAINLGFDISVKVYSFFLLLLAVAVALPYFKNLRALFWGQKQGFVEVRSYGLTRKWWVKLVVVLVLLGEGLMPYIARNSFNDDTAPRPFLHGAYRLEKNVLNYKNLFIHRENYLIFQTAADEFIDVRVSIDPLNKTLLLTDYDLKTMVWHYAFNRAKKQLVLTTATGSRLIGTSVDWRKLPLLRNQFHWTVD